MILLHKRPTGQNMILHESNYEYILESEEGTQIFLVNGSMIMVQESFVEVCDSLVGIKSNSGWDLK